MKVFYVDFHDVTSREALFRLMKENLPIPEESGDNLDALHDMLTEYGREWDIILYNTSGTERALGEYFRRFCRMCEDLSRSEQGIQIRIYP